MNAITVTSILPIIIGKIPKTLFNGAHLIPKINSDTPIFPIVPKPFTNKKAQIRNTHRIEMDAAAINSHFIPFSLTEFILILLLKM